VYFSRWRLPPSWIWKNCCHFFSIWPIVTKISGNIRTSIWNISMSSEMHICWNSWWWSPPSWILKTVVISLLFDQSSLNLVGILLLWFRTHWWRQKIYVTKMQDGGGRHLGFRKTAAISLLFDRSSPKFVETLGLRLESYRWRQKYIVSKIKDGGRHLLGFRKTDAISLLSDRSSPKFVKTLGLRFRSHRWRRNKST